jgi:Zinc knuckle
MIKWSHINVTWHFGMLLDKLQNDYLRGYNKYPRMLAAVFYLLVN